MIGAILQFLYFLVGFACVCVGVFGIAATKSERMVRAEKLVPTRSFYHYTSLPRRINDVYKDLTLQQLWWTLLCAAAWPLGIPLYLAWKKGTFIDEALAKREEMKNSQDLHAL